MRLHWLMVVPLLSAPIMPASAVDNPSTLDPYLFEVECLDWQHETPRQKFIDGPEFRDACVRYLTNRTPEEIAKDEAGERDDLKFAQKRWDDYAKQHTGKD